MTTTSRRAFLAALLLLVWYSCYFRSSFDQSDHPGICCCITAVTCQEAHTVHYTTLRALRVPIVIARFPFQIHNLEETLQGSKQEYGQRLAPLNKLILALQEELKEVRSQVAHQVETNHNLLCVKLKLEAEIDNYQQLIQGMTAEPER